MGCVSVALVILFAPPRLMFNIFHGLSLPVWLRGDRSSYLGLVSAESARVLVHDC